MNNEITDDKLDKYFDITSRALKMAKSAPQKENASKVIDMAQRYLSDAQHFRDKEEYVLAYGALNYAHGWLDTGAALGLFEVHDCNLFTVDE